MIEQPADRDAIRERLALMVQLWEKFTAADGGPALRTKDEGEIADAVIDIKTLLIVDLRCPTCEGQGAVSGFPETPWEQCPTCHSTGRRTVKVVEDSWDGLMSMLDDIYPADTFTGASGNPAPTVVVLLRQIDLLRRGEQPRSKVVDADHYARIAAVVRAMLVPEWMPGAVHDALAALTADDIGAVNDEE